MYTFVLELLEKELTNLKEELIIYTDGPTSEFKNKFITKSITDIKALANKAVVKWKYFATSHGKGAVDGIGWRAKILVRTATKSQKSGGCTVQSSEEFYNLVKKMPGTACLHVSENDIAKRVGEEKPWENVQCIPGIKKVHCIVCEKDNHVKLFTDDMSENMLTTVNYGESVSESEEESEKDVNVVCMKGDWVAVEYDNKYYPGQITQIAKDGSGSMKVM